MLMVKGVYKDGKIVLFEPIEGIREAELYIVVMPKTSAKSDKTNPDEAFFDYDPDDEDEKAAWANTSANSISEWRNPEEDKVWK